GGGWVVKEGGVEGGETVEVLLWHQTPWEAQTSNREGYASRDGVGFLHRSRVPVKARLDERVRPRADLAARDAARRAGVGRADSRDQAAAGRCQGAGPMGRAPGG